MSIKDLVRKGQEHVSCSEYLGREVYVEAFGNRRVGRVASVYRDNESGEMVCEIEWADGAMDARPFPRLKFTEA